MSSLFISIDEICELSKSNKIRGPCYGRSSCLHIDGILFKRVFGGMISHFTFKNRWVVIICLRGPCPIPLLGISQLYLAERKNHQKVDIRSSEQKTLAIPGAPEFTSTMSFHSYSSCCPDLSFVSCFE